ATSVPSNPSSHAVPSQNGLVADPPHRHRSYVSDGGSSGSSGAQSTGSPYSVSIWNVRPSGGVPRTRYGPFSRISILGSDCSFVIGEQRYRLAGAPSVS